jgi:glycosyltransferase involved in cell wall biosynthesis
MRILLISQYFSPEVFRINEVVQSLTAKGSVVHVLTGKPNYPEGKIFEGYSALGCKIEQALGATIYRVPIVSRGEGSALRLTLNYFSFIISGLLIGPWLLRNKRYDVVFVYGLSPILLAIPAIFLAWLKSRKLVVWVQDLWPESLSATGYLKDKKILAIVGVIVRWIYRHTDLLLVQSRAFIPSVGRLAPGKRIEYYPNSVDDSFAQQPSAEIVLPKIQALETGFPVVFAGNVGAAQAVEVILEAALLLRHIPEIRFVVIGHGSRWEWLREQVQVLRLTNLHLPGRFPLKTMPGLMQKAGALLVTLADEPIFAYTVPNKVQAYMAAGRPILCCLNGEGARLVKEAGAGLSVPAEDARALADAVSQLYLMTFEERAEMGANGRRYFKANFDHDQLIDELVVHLEAISLMDGEPA